MALLLLAIALQWPTKIELEASADRLRKSIPEVFVGTEEKDRWELWVDVDRPIKDRELTALRGYRGLTAIRLLSGGFGDQGLDNMRDLPDLAMLVVKSDQLTDAAIASAKRFKALNKIDFMGAKLTKKGLAEFAKFPKLSRLFLHGSEFSDDAALQLAKLKNLADLSLPKSLSVATVEMIQRALPGCRVKTY